MQLLSARAGGGGADAFGAVCALTLGTCRAASLLGASRAMVCRWEELLLGGDGGELTARPGRRAARGRALGPRA